MYYAPEDEAKASVGSGYVDALVGMGKNNCFVTLINYAPHLGLLFFVHFFASLFGLVSISSVFANVSAVIFTLIIIQRVNNLIKSKNS